MDKNFFKKIGLAVGITTAVAATPDKAISQNLADTKEKDTIEVVAPDSKLEKSFTINISDEKKITGDKINQQELIVNPGASGLRNNLLQESKSINFDYTLAKKDSSDVALKLEGGIGVDNYNDYSGKTIMPVGPDGFISETPTITSEGNKTIPSAHVGISVKSKEDPTKKVHFNYEAGPEINYKNNNVYGSFKVNPSIKLDIKKGGEKYGSIEGGVKVTLPIKNFSGTDQELYNMQQSGVGKMNAYVEGTGRLTKNISVKGSIQEETTGDVSVTGGLSFKIDGKNKKDEERKKIEDFEKNNKKD
ncbi:MAG: hypothetical protein WAV23_03500 [Minisyncoccia bacterium]